MRKTQKISLKTITKIAILSAIATLLMLLEFPLGFAPDFYKIDISEVAVLVGAFSLGPVAGVCIELIKILLNFIFNGTITSGIGELANFIIGCAFIVPASAIYWRHRTRKSAFIGMAVGTLSLCIVGTAINYFLLLPLYASIFGMPIEALIGMGTAINPKITDLFSFVLLAVFPFNLIKGAVVSVLTALLYKRMSVILHK